jgi:hypothetical protein
VACVGVLRRGPRGDMLNPPGGSIPPRCAPHLTSAARGSRRPPLPAPDPR